MSKTKVKWALVKYQPDLIDPREPILLGIVVVKMHSRKGEVAARGRVPNEERLPNELVGIGALGLAQIKDWGRSICREVVEAAKSGSSVDEVFRRVASKRRGNLYIEDAVKETLLTGSMGTILGTLTSRHLPWWAQLQKKPICEKDRLSAGDTVPNRQIPAAWIINEMARSLAKPMVTV